MSGKCRFTEPNYEGKHDECKEHCPIYDCTCYRWHEICYTAKGTMKPDECWKCINFEQETIEPDEEVAFGERVYVGGGWLDKCKLSCKGFKAHGETSCTKFINKFIK